MVVNGKWCLLLLLLLTVLDSQAQEWQWSATVDSVISKETNEAPVAFLWIPPNCKQVRGVVVGQHNMLEEGILEHAHFRKALTELGFAEVWITPGLDMIFRFDKGAGEYFTALMKKLGTVSGYTELAFAPVVPIGHSAAASYPWNFAAWNPGRTLALLSIHGDAPLTPLTGSGQPNPDWGTRTLDGVPGLMVMGEYEWWMNRLAPALQYRQLHPAAPVSFLADAGHGHFDYSDALVDYLALFIRKAAAARLPKQMSLNKPVLLQPVNPAAGWLADRWRMDSLPASPAAPYRNYTGDAAQAFWYFDKEMAVATEQYYAAARGKQPQYIGFTQEQHLLPFQLKSHARIVGAFKPMADGITFHLSAVYTDTVRQVLVKAHAAAPVNISRICGPVVKLNDTTFSIRFYRMGFNNPKRSGDIWLMATSEGDDAYKSTVQQFNMRIPVSNKEGAIQNIDFPSLPDVTIKTKTISLRAISSQQLPVYYYVQAGPAVVEGDQLVITELPPRTKYPVKITVVAWQYGRSVAPKVQSALPVSQTFYINK
jgi:hypothetical protein